jgi:murein L,D-transpeptidase YafK
MLLAHSRPLHNFGAFPSASYDRILALREEARARWSHYLAQPPQDRIPASLVKLSPQQSHVIVVDASQSRLYLFENRDGVPRLAHDFYATIGKQGMMKFEEGDQRTPLGVYFVTGFIDPEELPDLYGDGAFPIDYPNAWDQRHGRTGYGIWLHGTPSSTYSRPPRDSNGCVIVSNRDLDTLAPYMQAGKTPVVLTRDIRWLTEDQWRQRQDKFENFVEQWRRDWESRNSDLYLSHYSPQYSGLGKDYQGWVEYKRRVNSGKKFIDVDISDKSMFLYPGEDGLLVVTFKQEYKSNDIHRRFVKRQYWRMEEDGTWRIIYEGSVS